MEQSLKRPLPLFSKMLPYTLQRIWTFFADFDPCGPALHMVLYVVAESWGSFGAEDLLVLGKGGTS